jgi:hypothetical protein
VCETVAALVNLPASVSDICDLLRSGSSADRVGPVALRPRLTSGLPLSTSEARRRGQYPSQLGSVYITRLADAAR